MLKLRTDSIANSYMFPENAYSIQITPHTPHRFFNNNSIILDTTEKKRYCHETRIFYFWLAPIDVKTNHHLFRHLTKVSLNRNERDCKIKVNRNHNQKSDLFNRVRREIALCIFCWKVLLPENIMVSFMFELQLH